jgi:hypothetical protein
MTVYNFYVDPRVLYLFIDDLTEDRYNYYLNKYDKFKFKYKNDWEKTALGLLQVLSGESENNQMLIIGEKDGVEVPLAYYYVGDSVNEYSTKEEIDEYEDAMECLNKIIQDYKIKD